MTENTNDAPLTLLIDANNLICRLYYAIRGETMRRNANNLPDVASPYYQYMQEHLEEKFGLYLRQSFQQSLYNNLRHIIARYQPQYVMAAVDSEENFRKELYKGYKKRSTEKSKLLRELIQDIPESMRQLGILPVGADKYEADDVIATLAARAPGPVLIVTQDHDLFSILSPAIRVLGKGGLITEQDFIQCYGMLPPQLPFYKALVGDSSDQMRGVNYFRQNPGEALYIVTHYQTPAQLFGNIKELPALSGQSLKSVGQKNLERRVLIHTLWSQAPIKEL